MWQEALLACRRGAATSCEWSALKDRTASAAPQRYSRRGYLCRLRSTPSFSLSLPPWASKFCLSLPLIKSNSREQGALGWLPRTYIEQMGRGTCASKNAQSSPHEVYGNLRTVTLNRNPPMNGAQQTGIGIIFGRPTNQASGPYKIETIFSTGTASQSGQIHAGDLLFTVSGVSVLGLTAKQITHLLMGQPSSPVTLMISTPSKKAVALYSLSLSLSLDLSLSRSLARSLSLTLTHILVLAKMRKRHSQVSNGVHCCRLCKRNRQMSS